MAILQVWGCAIHSDRAIRCIGILRHPASDKRSHSFNERHAMNLRQLAYFLKIADLRSFTNAAAALFVSQPALSRQIQQLEEELGTALFIRSDRGLKLTDAGELLMLRAPAILSDIAQLRNELQSIHAQEPSGALSVGMGMALRELLNVPLITRFQSRYPKVQLQLREGITGPLVEDVRLGLHDCALVFELESQEQLIAEPFVRESLLLVGSAAAGLRLDQELSVAEALMHPLATTGSDSPLRRKTETAAVAAGLRLQVALETNAIAVMLECVATAPYFAVAPYSAISTKIASGKVSAAPIKDLSLDWTFVYSRNFGLSLPGRTFRTELFDFGAELIANKDWRFSTILY